MDLVVFLIFFFRSKSQKSITIPKLLTLKARERNKFQKKKNDIEKYNNNKVIYCYII